MSTFRNYFMSTIPVSCVYIYTHAFGRCFPTKAIYKDHRSDSLHYFNDVGEKKGLFHYYVRENAKP